MSAVLRHVAKYRPDWVIDYKAEEGKHQVGRGIVSNTFAYGQPYPHDYYDAEVQICLYDTWTNWQDRPNTRVSSCLHETFGLEWNESLGRYQVQVDHDSHLAALALVRGIKRIRERVYNPNYIALHYEGDSDQQRKNLTHEQADRICKLIVEKGYEPIILDWRKRCPLPYRRVCHPQEYGGNAEIVCAVISQCHAFIGIDSGPSKCASATNTPALVIWTGHHPAPFHDPAPNTTHLVPAGYHSLQPVCNDPGVIKWFESHYSIITYENGGLTRKVQDWLSQQRL